MTAERKNIVILGSGRSGTSMVTGALSRKGFFMGENLHPSSSGNPKGCFESWEINAINEELLAQVVPKRPFFGGFGFFKNRPRYMQRWLARVPVGTLMALSPALSERIQKAVRKTPFCFKDPRFSYTLPVWRPFFENTVFVCVFRNPLTTMASMLNECKEARYLSDFTLTLNRAAEVWSLMYRHILEEHRNHGDWLFVHYEQLFMEESIRRMEDFIGVTIDRDFPDRSLERSPEMGNMTFEMRQIYEKLCRLAGYQPDAVEKIETEALECAAL